MPTTNYFWPKNTELDYILILLNKKKRNVYFVPFFFAKYFDNHLSICLVK